MQTLKENIRQQIAELIQSGTLPEIPACAGAGLTVFDFDLETRSEIDLKKHGSYVYAYHESTEILLFLWSLTGYENEEVQAWRPHLEPIPPLMLAALLHPEVAKRGWNIIDFDNEVIEAILGVVIPVDMCIDGIVIARMHNLPASLKMCGKAVGADEQKDEAGKNYINLFSKPLPAKAVLRRQGFMFADWTTHPEDFAGFIYYGRQDVRSAKDIIQRLPKWNCTDTELERLMVNCAINKRGIPIDVPFVERTIELVERTNAALNERALEITGGIRPSQRAKFSAWLKTKGVNVKDMRKDTIDALLKRTDIHPDVMEVLKLSRATTSTSTAKYQVFKNYSIIDGRVRGMVKWYGAHTGRFSGSGPQVQNLPKGTVYPDKSQRFADRVRRFQAAMSRGWADFPMNADVIPLASSAIRGVIVAPDGQSFSQSDLSAIEGRGLAWVADEQWVLDAYNNGQDMYVRDFASCFGERYESVMEEYKAGTKEGKHKRTLGKPINLAFGYAAGVAGFLTFCRIYQIDPVQLAQELYRKDLLPDDVLNEARRLFFTPRFRKNIVATGLGNDMDTFCALDSVKRLWRRAHHGTARFWKSLDKAIREAIDNPSTVYLCGRDDCLKIDVVRFAGINYLRIFLPSGRYLSYAEPKISGRPAQPVFTGEVNEDGSLVMEFEEDDDTIISYMGPNAAGIMVKQYMHAGVFTENIVQAFCRDILCEGMVRAERDPEMTVYFHVHDEIITAGSKDNTARLTHHMTSDIHWAPGLPLGGEGWNFHRYIKD